MGCKSLFCRCAVAQEFETLLCLKLFRAYLYAENSMFLFVLLNDFTIFCMSTIAFTLSKANEVGMKLMCEFMVVYDVITDRAWSLFYTTIMFLRLLKRNCMHFVNTKIIETLQFYSWIEHRGFTKFW